ncbi:FHA domain-containing protein [candidate division KSB1 bacterium]|nr:FHA domain-containing protein [candidate division KSB1 bacterium]
MERNVCPFCKHINRLTNTFCTFCGAPLEKNQKTGPRMVLLLGDRHDGIFPLLMGENTIGRTSSNNISLADQQVSKQHARITYDDNHFWLEDLESMNGVYLNGRRLTHKERLFHGCVVKLGSTVLRFEVWPGR